MHFIVKIYLYAALYKIDFYNTTRPYWLTREAMLKIRPPVKTSELFCFTAWITVIQEFFLHKILHRRLTVCWQTKSVLSDKECFLFVYNEVESSSIRFGLSHKIENPL